MPLIDLDYQPPDTGLFTPEELALIQRVAGSDLWQLLARAMRDDREALYRAPVTTTEALHQRWGAISQLTHWLDAGPQLVVQYDRLRKLEKKHV